MNTPQLQNDKLKIINWIAQLEDAALVEKIKSLMKESGKPYLLTKEQQKILDSQVNSNKSLYTDAEVLFTDLKRIMGYKIIVSPVAEKNLQDAIEYYIKKAGKTVASNFLKDYKSVYKALQINPFYQFHDTNYRFLPFSDFPYIAFFIVDEDSKTVFLNAVFNTFQDPQKIQKK